MLNTSELKTEFVFNPASDETVDPEYVLLRNPNISIQCSAFDGCLDYCVNEHGGEGAGFWMKMHGDYKSLTKAMSKAIQIASN